MNIFLYIRQAISALKSNKLRAFLSTLWIIIWILSFVLMLSIWEWARKSVLDTFWSEWNIINVTEKYWGQEETSSRLKNIFTEEIKEWILKKVPNVVDVLPEYTTPQYWKMVFKTTEIWWSLTVVPRNYFSVKEVKTILGSTFWEVDYENKNKVAVIWYKMVKKIFWDENPIWQRINIWWELFTVAWVLEEKWWAFDESIYIPTTTSKEFFWKADIRWFYVYAKNESVVEEVTNNLKIFLFKHSWVENYSEVRFSVSSNKQFIQNIWEFQKMFSYFLIWLWGISLVVWWIWIMNIMLVSVTERTREIWIRKAIWATNLTIMLQFLIESIILTFIGSIVAILLSYWSVSLLNSFVKEVTWFDVHINTKVLVIAISVAISMWIIFGLMPAYKAARLKIIDALHFE